MGLEAAEIEAAMDDDSPRGALLALLLGRANLPTPGGAEAGGGGGGEASGAALEVQGVAVHAGPPAVAAWPALDGG